MCPTMYKSTTRMSRIICLLVSTQPRLTINALIYYRGILLYIYSWCLIHFRKCIPTLALSTTYLIHLIHLIYRSCKYVSINSVLKIAVSSGGWRKRRELTDSLQNVIRCILLLFSMNDIGCKCFHYPSCSTLRIELTFSDCKFIN